MSVSFESQNPVVRALLEGTAPRAAQVAASRGILPLPQNDLFEVLVGLSESKDSELATNAAQTLSDTDERLLEACVRSEETPATVLRYAASRDGLSDKVYEGLL